MATRYQKKNRRELAVGICTVILAVVLLVALAWWLNKPKAPETATAPTQSLLADNPYGPEDFAFVDDYLQCIAGESLAGIDVSYYQGQIDWQRVKAAGIDFVMIRVGRRAYVDGSLEVDPMAQEYYEGAKAAGLLVGSYFFSQAISREEALEEAELTLEVIRDWQLDLPLAYDWEYVSESARTADMDARAVTDCTLAFCRRIEEAGFLPMVYFNTYQSQDLLYLEEVAMYDFWLALYTDKMNFPYRVNMWQYTSTGTVPGITVDVDLNVALFYP